MIMKPCWMRFVLTHEHSDGSDHLVEANQARHHFDSFEEAAKARDLLTPSLEEKLGLKGIRVRLVECHESGDAKSTIFPREVEEVEPTQAWHGRYGLNKICVVQKVEDGNVHARIVASNGNEESDLVMPNLAFQDQFLLLPLERGMWPRPE